MRFGGIDEAGYGPLIGPLSVIGVAVACADAEALSAGFQRASTGVADSKRVHTPGDISAIEAVALPAIYWLTGQRPATACECFSLVGEPIPARSAFPWLSAAHTVALPLGDSAAPPAPWCVPGVTPLGLSGRIVQVPDYNATLARGLNKAEMELEAVGVILSALGAHGGDADITVDRLGGRRYYRDFLQSVWADAMVLIEEEGQLVSAYQVCGTVQQRVRFCVDGDATSLLTALASCIAKYVRELHMVLLNRFWCARQPTLAPTAGYVQDGRRWLAELQAEDLTAHRQLLVRHGMDGASAREPGAAAGPAATVVRRAPLAARNRSR